MQHVWENAESATLVDGVQIATDSEEIQKACRSFWARTWISRDPHDCGTSRVAEVVSFVNRRHVGRQRDIIINLQADEPDITGEDLDQLVLAMLRNPKADMATFAWKTNCVSPIAESRDNVKVVFSEGGRALYFSRGQIPRTAPWWIHAGVYAFRRDFLLEFASRPQSTLEKAENLEQLRALEMGANIHVEPLSHEAHGINTPADYRRFVRRELQPDAC